MLIHPSVIAGIRKPLPAREIAVNTIESHTAAVSISERYIPFFTVPRTRLVFVCAFCFRVLRPPIPGGAPRSCRPQNLPLQFSSTDCFRRGRQSDRPTFCQPDLQRPWRAENALSETRLSRSLLHFGWRR